jgi:hypothetical protein
MQSAEASGQQVEGRGEHEHPELLPVLVFYSSFFTLHFSFGWQGGRDSNPQPTVLETATLPIELPPYATSGAGRAQFPISPTAVDGLRACSTVASSVALRGSQAMTSVTRPAPIVRPPSRMAKRWPRSMATGAMTLTSTETLSPGITISTPWGRVTVPVTSVVRK